jgi:hypothetical protein
MNSSTFPESRIDPAARAERRPPPASLVPIYAALLALVAAGVLALVVALWPGEGVHPPSRHDLRLESPAERTGGDSSGAPSRPASRKSGERLRRAGPSRDLV